MVNRDYFGQEINFRLTIEQLTAGSRLRVEN